MKGTKIMQSLGDIDEDMILHARFHRRRPPAWLRWTSVAAVFLCIAILAAVLLSTLTAGPVGTHPDPNKPDALAPVPPSPAVPSVSVPAEPSKAPASPSPSPEIREAIQSAADLSPMDTEVISEEVPSPSPCFSPPEDDFLQDASLFRVGGVTFGMDDTDVIALLGEPDSSEESDGQRRMDYFGSTSFLFQKCDVCGSYHLEHIYENTGGSGAFPYGLTLDDSMADVLSCLGASELDTTGDRLIYAMDSTHRAYFETLYDNPQLHFISIIIGDLSWEMAFGRHNQLYINQVGVDPSSNLHRVHEAMTKPS